MTEGALLKTNFEKIIERMKEGGKLKNHSQIARALDVTPQALSNYKKRGRMPASLTIKFASLYNLSVDWLLNGKDGENRPRPTPTLPSSAVAKEDVSPYGKDFTRGLSPDEIICVGKMLKVLRKANKSTVNAMLFSLDAFTKVVEEAGEEPPCEK